MSGSTKDMSLPTTKTFNGPKLPNISIEVSNADNYHIHSVFGLQQPRICPNVPTDVLSPRATWGNDKGYYETAHKLAASFKENFKKFESYANEEIMAGAPPLG